MYHQKTRKLVHKDGGMWKDMETRSFREVAAPQGFSTVFGRLWTAVDSTQTSPDPDHDLLQNPLFL
jgi:hypothetical protein